MNRRINTQIEDDELEDQRQRIISQGTVEELIALAKEFNIHQVSTNKWYSTMCNQIKRKLEYYGVNPESVR